MLLPFAAPGDAVALVEFLCSLAAWHHAVGTHGWDEPVDAAATVLADCQLVADLRRVGSSDHPADSHKKLARAGVRGHRYPRTANAILVERCAVSRGPGRRTRRRSTGHRRPFEAAAPTRGARGARGAA